MFSVRFEKELLIEKYTENCAHLPNQLRDRLAELQVLKEGNIFAEEATYCGNTYKNDFFLFLNHDEYGECFFVLRIQLLVFDKAQRKILLAGNRQKVFNIHERGLMIVEKQKLETEIRDINDFIDKTPLGSYFEGDKQYLFIKHALPLID